jgi:hypothetical protein
MELRGLLEELRVANDYCTVEGLADATDQFDRNLEDFTAAAAAVREAMLSGKERDAVDPIVNAFIDSGLKILANGAVGPNDSDEDKGISPSTTKEDPYRRIVIDYLTGITPPKDEATDELNDATLPIINDMFDILRNDQTTVCDTMHAERYFLPAHDLVIDENASESDRFSALAFFAKVPGIAGHLLTLMRGQLGEQRLDERRPTYEVKLATQALVIEALLPSLTISRRQDLSSTEEQES